MEFLFLPMVLAILESKLAARCRFCFALLTRISLLYRYNFSAPPKLRPHVQFPYV